MFIDTILLQVLDTPAFINLFFCIAYFMFLCFCVSQTVYMLSKKATG